MSKYSSLLKKTEVFEKLATYGNKRDFFKSLAQALPQGVVAFPDPSLSEMLGRVGGAVSNLASMIENNPELSDEHGSAAQLASALEKFRNVNYMSSREQLDNEAKSLRETLNAVDNLEAFVNNAGSVAPDARNMAKMMKQEAQSAQHALTAFYREHGFPTTDYAQSPAEKAVVPPKPAAPPANAEIKTKPSDTAKRLANAVMQRVDNLPAGPERKAHLSVIESAVKSLQNLFRSLKKSSGIQDYFAKMEIVKALQKVYGALDYNDLEVVKSLDNGRGVPDSPDATI